MSLFRKCLCISIALYVVLAIALWISVDGEISSITSDLDFYNHYLVKSFPDLVSDKALLLEANSKEFIAKLDENLDIVWHKQISPQGIGGYNLDSGVNQDRMAIDKDDNVYLNYRSRSSAYVGLFKHNIGNYSLEGDFYYEVEDSKNKLLCFSYNLKTYNNKRSWNNAEGWANPENFDKYRW